MTNISKNVLPQPIWTTNAVTDYTYNGGNMSVTLPSTTLVPQITTGSGKIKLTGENPDIEIGEHSLMEILEGIRRQLALVKLHPDLEEEFEELRRIGDQYRAKEKELLEKRKVWETLKQ